MTRFSTATMIQRRQIIEDALATILERDFDITANGEGERCVVALGWADDAVSLIPLWTLASELEANLT